MKLRRLELRNFRCFEHLTVTFPPDLTVLVGNNGAGKSALLDGIAYALSRVLTRLPEVDGKNLRYEDIRLVQKDIRAPFVRVEAESTGGICWDRTLKRDATAQTAGQIPVAYGDKALFESLDPIIHAIAEGQRAMLPVFAYYGVSRAVFDIPERRRNFQKEFRRFDALSNALDASTRFRDLFEWFYAQERDEMERQLQALNTGAFESWENLLPVLTAVRKAVKAVIPGFSAPRIKTNPLRMVLIQSGANEPQRELSLQMLSDGYRTMLALVMDFARRMAQANPHLPDPLQAEAILLVDEIDLHLHPVWQQTVVPAFRRAFPNTQFIFSTHSPQVVTTVESEDVLIVDRAGVSPCPAPTYGARSSDVVAQVLGLPSLRPPENDIASKITSLFKALDEGRLDMAKSLRVELESWARGYPEPDLVRADVLIRRLDYQQKQSHGIAQS
jgi:predicted ATP-binding protein involved in virulence